MNIKIVLSAGLLVIAGAFLPGVVNAEPNAKNASPGPRAEGRPFMGVKVDPNPLPELLCKHLGLKSPEGLLIYNVLVNSPADRAGLERDDIIVAFQGKAIRGYDDFVSDIHHEGVGAEVALAIIHLGQRREVKLKLESMGQVGAEKWKYSFGPESGMPERMRPGRVFRLPSGGGHWQQITPEEMPELKDYFRRFFLHRYTYHVGEGDKSFEVTIEGDPDSSGAQVAVRDHEVEYRTGVDKIDQLPEKYRAAARESLAKARKSAEDMEFRFEMPQAPDRAPGWGGDHPGVPERGHAPRPRQDRQERLRQEMQQLREELQRMEKQQQDLRERLDEMLDEDTAS